MFQQQLLPSSDKRSYQLPQTYNEKEKNTFFPAKLK